MRVLVWSEHYWPLLGGVEMAAYHLVRELGRRGHELRVIARRDHPELPERQEAFGVPILRLAYHEAIAAGDLASVERTLHLVDSEIRSFRPDLLHLFSLGSNLLVRERVRAAAALPLVLTLHGAAL
ncbi:MAG TPA: hypothetical protein ENK19_09550, partial [Acidobacteria bacterium]|nr:hypothetical protein [Acidobacteriota bacterium]